MSLSTTRKPSENRLTFLSLLLYHRRNHIVSVSNIVMCSRKNMSKLMFARANILCGKATGQRRKPHRKNIKKNKRCYYIVRSAFIRSHSSQASLARKNVRRMIERASLLASLDRALHFPDPSIASLNYLPFQCRSDYEDCASCVRSMTRLICQSPWEYSGTSRVLSVG